MIEIIPAIIEDGWGEIESKLSRLAGKTKWVHLDASDGVFTNHKTWNSPGDLSKIDSGVSIEAHLMLTRPWEAIDLWFQDPVQRIIIHHEAFNSNEEIGRAVSFIKSRGREAVLAINPGTAQLAVEPFVGSIDAVLVMGVEPGWSGSKFHPEITGKIKALREIWPDGIIGVDGGINAERAPALMSAGANRLVSSSFIWSFDDPAEGIRSIRDAARS